MRRVIGVAATVAALWPAVVPVGGASPQRTVAAGCRRAPRLVSLTLARSRRLAAESGCRIRVAGAPILGPYGQRPLVRVSGGEGRRRIARQAPRPGGRAQTIDVWLVPECAEMGAPGAPPGEPFVRSGPTELISGVYLAGGPFEVFPGACRKGVPEAGRITVAARPSGTTVARAGVARGHLATIPLPPGTYTIDATFADATANGRPMTSSAWVTIPPGKTVRLDIVASVP
jgi:hypothetical protein